MLWTFLAVLCLGSGVQAANILFLLPIASKSHVHIFEPLARELALRNHNIVVLAPVPMTNMSSTVTQHQIITDEEIFGGMPNPFEMRKMGMFKAFGASTNLIDKCGQVLTTPKFQEILTQSFDLVIIDILMSYCSAGAIPVLRAPSILVTCYPAPALVTNDFGNRLAPSFVVDPMLHLPSDMSFFQRAVNTLFGFVMYFGSEFGFVSPSEKLYKEKLPQGDQLPSIHQIQKNASLLFSNSHWAVTNPRPLLPDVIEIGGIHTRPGQELPQGLKRWADEASNGFIFFSMGSILKANSMPVEVRDVFVKVFSSLKVKVLWKWESETMPGVVDGGNILLSKWLPQQDILAHPNIKLFISHGGLLSTQETVFHGVPMLAIPIWGDQDLNSKRVAALGIANIAEILTLTETSLRDLISEMLENPSYTRKARELSVIFKDIPETPLEKAVFWTEYVIRHKGAPHLRSYARDLNFWQHYLLDVTAFIILIATVLSALSVKLLKRICCRRRTGKNQKATKTE